MNTFPQDKHRRILIIDDNPTIHEDFRKILCAPAIDSGYDELRAELLGDTTPPPKPVVFEVDSAFQGKEGLDRVEQALKASRPYALAFVDVRMPPGWDGIETTAKIWEMDPDLQVVICTAYSDYSWEEMIAKLGQSDRLVILKKPFDNVEVLQLANSLTEKWRLLQKAKNKIDDLEQLVAARTEELRKSEAHLRQSQKMEAIGQLAGGIAHDFNNILGCIVGYAELATVAVAGKEPVRAYLQEVLKASQRAKELVLQILAFSRQQTHERKSIRLQPVLEEALKLLQASLPATIQIRAEVAAEAPPVMADAIQIHQVLMNLATNAAHAMNQRGLLTIQLSMREIDLEVTRNHPELRVGRYAVLTVCDTGCGMDRATLQRMFEPFFTTKPPGEGTGLGLAVVHGIMKSHDGAISVYSEPGRGTTIQLYFPAQEGSATEMARSPGPIPAGHGEHILFVDDEAPLASLGKKMLAGVGYEVTAETNSIQALAAFRAEPGRYDLVITDLTMPNLTGTDLACELLKLRPDLPIILATGFVGSMTPGIAQAMGIRELLMKPATMRSLAESAQRALQRSAG